MGELPDHVKSEVRSIRQSLRELEERVNVLERGAPASSEKLPAPSFASAEGVPGGLLAGVGSDQVIPLFGWAFLGLAGAYLLRAATEAGVLPGAAGAVVGIAYAGWWLLMASRAPVEKPLFSTVHGLTAALILTPLLWETTVRFGVLGPAAASAIVSGFAVWGLAIAWKRNVTSIAWIVTLAGLLTSTALFRERHDAAAWLASVLFIALAVEFSACRDHWLSLRWMTAAAADLTVLLTTMFQTMFAKTPEWAPSPQLVLAGQIALLTIYLASTVDRTILRGLSITGFEMGQAAVAFAVSIGGAFYLAQAANTGSTILGLFCMLGGMACYLVSFAFLERRQSQGRNFHTYSTFAILLTSAGFLTLLDGAALAAAWSCLAAAMMVIGIRGERTTLRVHAGAYLLAAVARAGFLGESWTRIVRAEVTPLPFPAAYYFVLVGVTVVYGVILWLEGQRTPHWTDRIESTAAAALSLMGALALLSEGLTQLPVQSLSIRTGMLLASVLGLALSAGRWGRAELSLLVFPVLALTGYKVLMEEFQRDTSAHLVVSLILFGGTLILLPRLRRARKSESATESVPEAETAAQAQSAN